MSSALVQIVAKVYKTFRAKPDFDKNRKIWGHVPRIFRR